MTNLIEITVKAGLADTRRLTINVAAIQSFAPYEDRTDLLMLGGIRYIVLEGYGSFASRVSEALT